jgi:hypothetical protein
VIHSKGILSAEPDLFGLSKVVRMHHYVP